MQSIYRSGDAKVASNNVKTNIVYSNETYSDDYLVTLTRHSFRKLTKMMLKNSYMVLFAMIIQATCVTKKHSTIMRPSIQERKNRKGVESVRSIQADGVLQTAPSKSQDIACYECSSFPPEEDSQDEPLGSCPGWKREGKTYGVGSDGTTGNSLYDACMTIVLSNGTVVSQNAVVYTQCIDYKTGSLPSALYRIFAMSTKIYCCRGSLCNGPTEIRLANSKRVGKEYSKVSCKTQIDYAISQGPRWLCNMLVNLFLVCGIHIMGLKSQ